jgi:phytoene synthase
MIGKSSASSIQNGPSDKGTAPLIYESEIARNLVSPADLAACRAMIKAGSKTFYTSSKLLPRRIRDAARQLYAFCRVADDVVDESDDIAAAVDSLRVRLDAIYALKPEPFSADRAFADLALSYSIPRSLPEALIDGFAWDASGRRYATIHEVYAYAVRVAGTVGAMMAIIMRVRSDEAIARACDLGVAMQLSNIARDVGADAAIGRLYLPEDWMREEGLDPDTFMSKPKPSEALARVIERLLQEADRLYARSVAGIAMLPKPCRPAIHASRLLYAAIGHHVRLNGYDSVTRRAVVSKSRKLALLASAIKVSLFSTDRHSYPVLDEAAFIVDAVKEAPEPKPLPETMDEKAEWVTNLFIRLANTDR